MKKLLLLLLCVPLMFSCGENHKSENSIEKESSNEEETISVLSTELTYKNGDSIQWVYVVGFMGDVYYQDSLFNGICIEVYPNGKLKRKVQFQNGQRYGLFKKYYEKGQLWEEGNFQIVLDRNTFKPFSIKNGTWRKFYENGKISQEDYFSGGTIYKYVMVKEDGSFSINTDPDMGNETTNFYSKDSILLREKIIQNQELISDKCWNLDGNEIDCPEDITSSTRYHSVDGITIIEEYENGKLMSEEKKKDGELISKKCWDEDGNEIDCEQ